MTNEKAVKILKSSMLMHSYRYSAEELEEAFDLAIKALENDRPRGEWIIDGHHYKCSQCGKTLAIIFSETDDDNLIGCPFCLADMRGGSE